MSGHLTNSNVMRQGSGGIAPEADDIFRFSHLNDNLNNTNCTLFTIYFGAGARIVSLFFFVRLVEGCIPIPLDPPLGMSDSYFRILDTAQHRPTPI